MAWIEIMPRYEAMFRRLGWDSAAPFLAWTGILVNRHRKRSVEQVAFTECHPDAKPQAEDVFFIKKESAVSWRDRLRNAWHGFGWCATAVREAAMLQALQQGGVGCPEVAALGEDGRHAFVLTRAETTMTELRALLPTLLFDDERARLAAALGPELAKMHDAGFDHPDLFAKHILASNENRSFRICILDWQRGRRRRFMSWRRRCQNLAMLDATLHSDLASDRWRLRLLSAYCRALKQGTAPPLRILVRQIRRLAQRLSQRRRVREIGELPVPAHDQQFVPILNGRLLLVRSYFEELGGDIPAWLTALVNTDATLPASVSSSEEWAVHEAEASEDMPALAHQLFRQHRLGKPGPRLAALVFGAGRTLVVTRCARARERQAA